MAVVEYVEDMTTRRQMDALMVRIGDLDMVPGPKPAVVTAEHVAFAWVLLMDLEAKHASRERVNEARRRAKALTRRWKLAVGAEDRRLDGRSGEDGSMTHGHMSPVRDVRK